GTSALPLVRPNGDLTIVYKVVRLHDSVHKGNPQRASSAKGDRTTQTFPHDPTPSEGVIQTRRPHAEVRAGRRGRPPPPRCSRAGELLDAVVERIGDVDVPAPVGRHAKGIVELSVARAETPPRGEEGPARIGLLDALVARIGDVDVPAPVGRHAKGLVELSVARAAAPPRGEEGTARIELLDAVVARIGDVDVPAPVGRHVAGGAELSVARAET